MTAKMTDRREQIDLATDARAAQLREELGELTAAMRELLDYPDRDPLATKMAARVRSTPQTPDDEEACKRSRIEFIERKRKLIHSIAQSYDPGWHPITVIIKPNGQVWPTDGMHRTASLLALGRNVPAVIGESGKDSE